jgi:hypothetical protein
VFVFQLVGSAPGYPHGVVDPIVEIAQVSIADNSSSSAYVLYIERITAVFISHHLGSVIPTSALLKNEGEFTASFTFTP